MCFFRADTQQSLNFFLSHTNVSGQMFTPFVLETFFIGLLSSSFSLEGYPQICCTAVLLEHSFSVPLCQSPCPLDPMSSCSLLAPCLAKAVWGLRRHLGPSCSVHVHPSNPCVSPHCWSLSLWGPWVNWLASHWYPLCSAFHLAHIHGKPLCTEHSSSSLCT